MCRRNRFAPYRYTHVVRDALSILPAPLGSGKAMGWRPPPPRPRSFASGRRAPRSRSRASGPRGDHQGLAAASPSWYRRAVNPKGSGGWEKEFRDEPEAQRRILVHRPCSRPTWSSQPHGAACNNEHPTPAEACQRGILMTHPQHRVGVSQNIYCGTRSLKLAPHIHMRPRSMSGCRSSTFRTGTPCATVAPVCFHWTEAFDTCFVPLSIMSTRDD